MRFARTSKSMSNRPKSLVDLEVDHARHVSCADVVMASLPALSMGASVPIYSPGGANSGCPDGHADHRRRAFANSTLTVADTSPYVNDRINIESADGLVVSGKSLIFDGTTIGTFTAGRTVTITFNAAATQAGILAVVQNITFTNIVPTPMIANRPISFIDESRQPGLSRHDDANRGADAPPSLSVSAPATTYKSGSAPIVVAPTAALSIGTGAYANSSLTVADTSPYVNDRLGIASSGGLVVSGKSLIFNGIVIGSITTDGNRTLTFTFNANTTQAVILAVAENITFSNIVAKPMLGKRAISFHLRVGSTGYVVSATDTVQVVANA